jgi:hypothetical protein
MSFSEGPQGRNATAVRPLVVEFVGTPGSGKTTLSTALVALLGERRVGAATIVGAAREHASRTLLGRAIERLAPHSFKRAFLWQVFYLLGAIHAFGFARDQHALTRHVVGTQLGRLIPRSTRRHILFWFFQLGGRYRFLTATPFPGGVLVLDDGFLHRCVHLTASHVEEPDAERVAAYVDLLPRPDLVVFTTAGLEACERRVWERGVWPHSQHLSAAELSRYLRNAERAVQLAVRRARERGWTVVEIANEGRDPHMVARDLARAVERLLDVGSPDGRGENERPEMRALT